MDTLSIQDVSPDAPDVRALLHAHFELMRATSPEESCHVMEPDAVSQAGVTMLGAYHAETLIGIGAFKIIAAQHAKLKSMHTAAAARGKGAARQVLNALIARAQSAGMRRLSLETGSDAVFDAARALYHTSGFADCPPFGSYTLDPHSVFMTREI